jgi:tight adherence protein C
VNESLIPILTFIAVVSLGGAVIVAKAAWKLRVQARLEQVGAAGHQVSLSNRSGLSRFFGQIGRVASSNGPSSGLRAELAWAGFHDRSAGLVYLGIKMFLLAVGLMGCAAALIPFEQLTPATRIMLILIGGALLSFLPNIYVRWRRERRRAEVRSSLADMIDLLEISVSAGLGLDAAWNSVSREIRGVSPTLSDEMELTNLEIHLGAPRAEAMRHMADRTGAEEIASLVSVLVQSERFGTSVASALRTFANSMREIRSQRAEESAEKMPVKLLLPMALCIFPAVLIVLAGPAGIQWAEILGSN